MSFSVITPTLDRPTFLREAVESVARQAPNCRVEHIIIDSGDAAQAHEIASRYPHVRVIRQRPMGVYAAWNAGIAASTNDVIVHLNDDDLLPENALRAAADAFARRPDADGVRGSVMTVATDGTRGREIPPRPLTVENVIWSEPAINGIYFRRRFYAECGLYLTEFKVASDREFLLRVCFRGPQIDLIGDALYTYRLHPTSLTMTGGSKDVMGEEFAKVARQLLACQTEVPASDRRHLRMWHAIQAGLHTRRLCAAGLWSAALRYALCEMRSLPSWPFRYMKRLATTRFRG